jgi:LacI family transcriptional regulator
MPIKRDGRTRRSKPGAGATIHDVAARAGVSAATVSRVLNGKEDLVREETSRQVHDAARALRYVPNIAARSLSIRRHHAVGVVLPDVHGEFFSELIRGIDLAARREGYHLLVSGSHSDAKEMVEVLDTMRGRVDGLVVMAPDVRPGSPAWDRDSLPLVLLNSASDAHDVITIDNYGGARMMMDHLQSLGHTRIAFIGGPPHNNDARERLRGYRQAMRRISSAVRLELPGDFTEESGHAAAERVLAESVRPTAIFAANDAMAVGALAALAAAGVQVPREIAVSGFDDIPIARYVTPPLTTVRVDIAEMGRRAFSLLRESLGGARGAQPRNECITTTLVVRGSCGAHPPVYQTSTPANRALRGQKGEK